MLDVGRVVKPHGLKGQVVVELWTNRSERMAAGSALHCGERVLEVAAASPVPGMGGRARWLVTFSGVGSREEAEALRESVLCADPVPVEGAMWVHEMIGSDLFDPSGARVGRVEAVEANPASDLLVLDDGRLVPLTFVSWTQGRLVVDGPPGLLDQLDQ